MRDEATLLQIRVMSRPALGQMSAEEPFILISVTDPGSDEALYADTPLCRGVLRLQFDDAEYKGQTPRGKTLISKQDADAILALVQQHVMETREPVHTIICQCEMGRSRSAGIAAALSNILTGEDATFFTHYYPNRWVYQTILDQHAQQQNTITSSLTRK